MKDLLGRFGFTEFFTVICPGVLLLLSFGVWLPNETLDKLNWTAMEPTKLDSLALAVVLAVLAYCLGMLINVVATRSAIFSDFLVVKLTVTSRVQRNLIQPFSSFLWLLQGTFDYQPETLFPMVYDLGVRLELLSDRKAFPNSPFEVVSGYRLLASGSFQEKWQPLLEYIGEVHRRRIFAQATSCVLALVTIQSTIRLWLYDDSGFGFFWLGLGAYLASFGLRFAVSSLWEQEVLYTYRIYLLASPAAGWTPAA